MKNFRQLKVWQKAHQLTLKVYAVSRVFPKEELFGLTSQIRRSAMSIPSNIAEGCGRTGDVEFRRFLVIAMGSANELDYQLLLGFDLGFIPAKEYEELTTVLIEVQKILNVLINKTLTTNS